MKKKKRLSWAQNKQSMYAHSMSLKGIWIVGIREPWKQNQTFAQRAPCSITESATNALEICILSG